VSEVPELELDTYAPRVRPVREPARQVRRTHDRRPVIRFYELLVSVPVVAYLIWSAWTDPQMFTDWYVFAWAAAVMVAELLPVPTNVSMGFSLSFPLELSAAMLFPTPTAAAIAFLGSADAREFKGQIPPLKAVFVRSQIALCVIAESAIFNHTVSRNVHAALGDVLQGPPWKLILPTLLAAIVGYALNTFLVATYHHFQHHTPILATIREMHAGVFGEFVLSYMALALFAVLVATSVHNLGVFAILVFAAPLAFARQMFQRTHSLQEATNELAEKQAENEYQALHDSLTGMPNRMLFQLKLADAIEASRRVDGKLAVMLIDLDHFKEINDTLGHHFGDQLLKEIGPRLSTVLRDNDLMARLGGDEFGVLLPDIPDQKVAVRIAERLMEELEHPITVEGLALDVSGSVGIAIFPTQSEDADTLLRRADVAMYAAKEAGGGYEMYHEGMDRHHPSRLTLIGQVRPAIENNEFVVFYQPKVRLSDGRVAGAEALVRWQHPERGLVPPDEFIPFVEKTVLLRPLTLYVFNDVLRQWRRWADDGIRMPVSVNLSPRSLLDKQLPEQVAELLSRWEVPPRFLKVELTESFLMAESGRSAGVLDRLSDIGIGLSIDDFGTGYSSLSHLKRLPIDEIKVDRSFVTHMHSDSNDFLIVRATIELGRNLGLLVVAEGVEDLEAFDRLADFGCDEAQGYYISRPMPADAFTRWLWVRGPESIVYKDAPSPPDSAPAPAPADERSRRRLRVSSAPFSSPG
jgi:diguanylate cyclase (GGDEF)-like protein